MKVSQLLETAAAPKASTRVKTPAYLRKAKAGNGGNWKLTLTDPKAAEKENISGTEGLEELKAKLNIR